MFPLKRIISHALFNLKYLFYWKLRTKPQVLSSENTVRAIVDNHFSVVRFGNGEFELMVGHSTIAGVFQETSPGLVRDLFLSLQPNKHIMVCIPLRLRKELPLSPLAASWWKEWVVRYFQKVKRVLPRNAVYGNASFTRFYMDYQKDEQRIHLLECEYLPLLSKIWEGRKVLVVEGYNSMLGTRSGLLSNAAMVRRILCPNKNAYDRKEEIEDAVLFSASQFDLVLFALGPTATVLAYELSTKHGIWCIDIGHLEVENLWLRFRCTDKVSFDGMNSAESKSTTNISVPYDRVIFASEVLTKL